MIGRARRFARDRRGSTMVEFAMISTPLILMMLALVDLGFRAYMQSQLEGSLEQASRKVTVGAVNATGAAVASSTIIESFVRARMRLILPNATVTVVPKAYDDFTDIGKPEPITTDTAPIGTYNTGDCFTDLNANGIWDSDGAATSASTAIVGTGDDIIYYTATASFPAIMPLGRWLGWASTEKVVSTIAVRNQPFGAQAQPKTVCT